MVNSVLVVGIYLQDKPNHIAPIKNEFGQSRRWQVTQRWIALGTSPIPDEVAAVTVRKVVPPGTKFALLNQLLAGSDIGAFDFIVVCDDDILLPANFLDRYLELVMRYDFALAQPARTHDSFTDHPFVEQMDGLAARWTRFVEIGPLFSLDRRAFPLLLPFDESSPMGWGYDFFWPRIIADAGLKMGIVDAAPVAHNLRKPVLYYEAETGQREMANFLAQRPHLSPDEAFFIIDSYAPEE